HRGAHHDAVPGRGVDVDRVVTHAPAGDDAKVGRLTEHTLAVGLAARERGEDTGQSPSQLVLGHLPVATDPSLDLKPGFLETAEVGRIPLIGVRDGDQDATRGHRGGFIASREWPRQGHGRWSRTRDRSWFASAFDATPARA